MSLTISPQTRAIALVAVLVAVALGLAVMAFSHFSSGSTAQPKVIKPLHPVRHHAVAVPKKVKAPSTHAPVIHAAVVKHAVAKPVVTKAVARPKVTKAVVAKPKVTKAAVAPKPVHKAVVHPVALQQAMAADGLPRVVVRALEHHAVVVVALYQRRLGAKPRQILQAQRGLKVDAAVGIDQLSLGEAAAGSRDAGAGFVGVDVLSQRQAAPLAALNGVLSDPMVLVYERPVSTPKTFSVEQHATLSVKLTGFADRATVAQAAFAAAGAARAAGVAAAQGQ